MQVQFSLSITINPPTPPLAESASSGSTTFTQGEASSSGPLAAITGGIPPYAVSVDASSPNQLPDGLSASIDADNNLVVSGTPTVAGSGSVLLDITDSTGASVAKAAVR